MSGTEEQLAWEEELYLARKKPRPADIRTLLAREWKFARAVVMQLMVPPELDDAMLVSEFKHACAVLKDLGTYEWGTAGKKRNIERLARDPSALVGIRGAAARADEVSLEMLAVLVKDGQRDSIDALLPHLDPALVTGDERLDRLKFLRPFAAASMRTIFDEIDETHARRAAKSPVLALGPAIGIGQISELRFRVSFHSTNTAGQFADPKYWGVVAGDSRAATSFEVDLHRTITRQGQSREGISFDEADVHYDDLTLGRCAPTELPAWIARAGKKLKTAWTFTAPTTNLRGKKRDQLMAWLRG